MAKLTQLDLAEARALQREALRAIDREDYVAAWNLACAVDQVFYEKRVDLVEATEFDPNLTEIYRSQRGSRTTWCGKKIKYSWEMPRS